ncbi:MAG: YncE family protein [Gaiella sp.]
MRRILSLGVVAALATALAAAARTAAPALPPVQLLVSGSSGSKVWLVDLPAGDVHGIEAGASPWGIAVSGRTAYVSTARGVAVVDIRLRRRVASLPYRAPIENVSYGEYRGGGMGIAVTPDGTRVAVGVYRDGRPSTLEILDTRRRRFTAAVPIGDRPFDVLVSRDGREAYTIDHDSYSVTVVDLGSRARRTIPVRPLGTGAFDKPHYAALAPDGRLLLPVQGQVLALVDPANGEIETRKLTADTHQHGVAFTAGGRLVVVGTGPAGGTSRPPSLTIYNLARGAERVIPLGRPHEQVAVTRNGSWAFLTGGYLLGGGFDGITAVHLATGRRHRIAVPDLPLGVAVVAEGR